MGQPLRSMWEPHPHSSLQRLTEYAPLLISEREPVPSITNPSLSLSRWCWGNLLLNKT
jgi:hypothetical protein